MYYCYILTCNDNTLYCGYTNNIENRIKVHNSGKGAKYTKYRLPVKLIYYESFNTKSEAMKREFVIKKLNKKQKIKLIMGYLGLDHWGESDNASGFYYNIQESISKMVSKELKRKDNSLNTDGYINIALLLEDEVFSIRLLTHDQVYKLMDKLKENIKISKDDKYHLDSYKRLLSFVEKEFKKQFKGEI
jgi:putative endonuclease